MSLAISSPASYAYTPVTSARAAVSGKGTAAAAAQGSAQNKSVASEEQAALDKLKARDRQVRQHEQAHLAAAGGLATSGANYTYERGSDGQNYAVGGEVSIDTSPGRTPEETLSKAQTIRAAALAPADPSGQDRAVAAEASQMAAQASAELAQQKMQGGNNSSSSQENKSQAAVARAYSAGPEAGASRISAYA
jgi:hypothetical protein